MTGETTGGPTTRVELAFEPGDLIRHFMVLDVLGKGGEGIVLSAYDPGLDRKVALKLVRPATGDAGELLREAQALARLAHPNVVTIYEAGTFGDHVCIAMEHLDGSTAEAWLATERRSLREIVEVFVAAGRGLAAAHAAGLVHCDVKPRNMMVLGDGGVRLVDFGLARAAGSESTRAGTPAYMSPEQVRGDAIDALSDQYSFCVALHEAATGALPGERARHAIPPWLERILARGVAPEPARRFRAMGPLLAELARDRAARTRRIVFVSTAVAAVAVAAFAPWSRGDAPTCPDPASEVNAVWTAERATAIAAHGALGSRTRAQLEAYAAALIEGREHACRAAVRETPAMFELRTACLDERVAALRSAAEALAGADQAIAERGLELAARLPRVEDCADAARLLVRVMPPADPVSRVAVADIRDRLAGAQTQQTLGRTDLALALARDAHQRASTLDYLPIQAEAEVSFGSALAYTGERAESIAHLRNAVRLALRGRHFVAAAAAWDRLVYMLGIEGNARDEAFAVADDALAIVEGVPGEEPRIASILFRRGIVRAHFRQLAEAERDLSAALAIRQRVLGPDHPDTTASLHQLGTTVNDRGDHAAALGYLTRARAGYLALSPLHPWAVYVGQEVARTLRDLGRAGESLTLLDELEPVATRVYAADPYGVRARLRDERGSSLFALGRFVEATTVHREALAQARASVGDSRDPVMAIHTHLGDDLIASGDLTGARTHHARSVELSIVAYGAGDPRCAPALAGLARANAAIRAQK